MPAATTSTTCRAKSDLTGNLWGSTSSGQTKGYQRTREAFGEIEIPVLEDVRSAVR